MAKLKGPLFSLGATQQIGKTLVYFPWKGLSVARTYVIPSNPKTDPQETQRGYVKAVVPAIHQAQALTLDPLASDDVSAYALLASTFPTPRTWFNAICKQWIDQYVDSLKAAICRGSVITPGASQLTVRLLLTATGENNVTAATFMYGTSKSALINSKAATVTPPTTEWTAEAEKTLDALVVAVAGPPYPFAYQCTTAGTTGVGEPTWPTTLGETVVDATVTWTCVPNKTAVCKAVITDLTPGTKYYLQLRPSAHADFVGVRSGIYYAVPTAA